MKISTGIVRKIDELGRIVIPMEIRKELNINIKDRMEISKEGNSIILKKYENRCVFCGKLKPEYNFEEKKLCKNCLENIKNKF